MEADFAAARRHLHAARDDLCGDDRTSGKARHALDLLLEAIVTAEKPVAMPTSSPNVVPFPPRRVP
ncbi:hypothetical protein N1F89_06065 [Aquibium sp. A9E412]|uniref:hypothetical protein n=1 Tax=Aquibium sp. A9E412 TaxID=2976767 RepID=UPI0025AF786A|nr:hypothetical protein [Aquibium sp. A9E412]MDN2565781.1 hypothetical protein [Aquibium sp. A9E412]